MSVGGPYLAAASAAAALVFGLAQVATIAQQKPAVAMKEGGPVTSGSGTKDDVPALLMRGEYVQPAPTVRYYGADIMEAIRRRVIPRDILKGFGFFPVARPQFAFAEGGMVSGRGAVSGGESASNRGQAAPRNNGPAGDLNMAFYLDGEPFFKVIDKGIRDGRLKTYKLVPV